MRYAAAIVLLLASTALCQGNPFLSSSEEQVSSPPVQSIPVPRGITAESAALQRELQSSIADMLSAVKSGEGYGKLFSVLGAAFIYGMLHAMGPGHRKGILLSFFAGEKHTPLKGAAAGFLLALVHALSSVLLVGGIYFLTSRTLSTSVNSAGNTLMTVTWVMVLLLGGWMIHRGLRKNHRETAKKTGFTALVLSGAVPCPAASAVMILAIAGEAFPLGVVTVAAMSLGMGTLLAATGLSAVLLRRVLAERRSPERASKIETVLHLVSGGAMILFAGFMLAGSL